MARAGERDREMPTANSSIQQLVARAQPDPTAEQPAASSSEAADMASARPWGSKGELPPPEGTEAIPAMTLQEHYHWITDQGHHAQLHRARTVAPKSLPSNQKRGKHNTAKAHKAQASTHFGGQQQDTETATRSRPQPHKHEGVGAMRTRSKQLHYRRKQYLKRNGLRHTRRGVSQPNPAVSQSSSVSSSRPGETTAPRNDQPAAGTRSRTRIVPREHRTMPHDSYQLRVNRPQQAPAPNHHKHAGPHQATKRNLSPHTATTTARAPASTAIKS